MNCTEALATLSTASLRDMTPDSDVMLHCDACPDCARVTTILRDREYEAATVLNGIPPMSNPILVAEQSVIASKRRRLGRVAVIASGTALVASIWIGSALTIIPALNQSDANIATTLHTETIQLSCLSPQQAADIINPYVRSHGSTYYIPTTGISAITVRGTRDELAKSRNLIHDFENDPKAACHLPETTPVSADEHSLMNADKNAASHVTPDIPTPPKTR
jgi:type II secretory pathway component GspD/PulD (secretin)